MKDMEQEQGWDPDVKQFFLKILNTLCYGLIWLIAICTAGIYYGLGSTENSKLIYVLLFYFVAVITLLLLLRYYYRLWRSNF
jgi:hypothetical protein